MENVVYLLGAGFSAPLGIPVIRDFLLKAKDLYYKHPDKYSHFQSVLDQIDVMQKAQSFFSVDLYDIEEILSILDMQDQVTGGNRSKLFGEFVGDVVQAYTPEIEEPQLEKDGLGYRPPSEKFSSHLFGGATSIQAHYGQFVANLVNLRVSVEPFSINDERRVSFVASTVENPETQYSIVTLNYDRVIENCIAQINRFLRRRGEREGPKIAAPDIAKLHGSVGELIVAPTWKKWAVGDLQKHWALAHKLLSKANHIRIVGYSLPVSDSYVRYLLCSAALESQNLKSIDVICLDDAKESVRRRYEDLIRFKFFRFTNGDVRDYVNPQLPRWLGSGLRSFHEKSSRGDVSHRMWADYTRLEEFHWEFMEVHGKA